MDLKQVDVAHGFPPIAISFMANRRRDFLFLLAAENIRSISHVKRCSCCRVINKIYFLSIGYHPQLNEPFQYFPNSALNQTRKMKRCTIVV